MIDSLKPWAYGPFELLAHAELHIRDGEDFDRRIALISFDNAIEVAITTYLSLHPIQRQNRVYPKPQVQQWLENFHTKIDFFINEVQTRAIRCECEKADMVWYHDVRNGQYHGGGATIPQERELQGIRKAAFWVFSVLFDVSNVDRLVESHVLLRTNNNLPARTDESDKVIDAAYGMCEIAGESYYTSEALYAIDPVAYSEEAADLMMRPQQLGTQGL
jgi:hypothetical protein